MGSDGKQGDGCKHASKRRLKVWPPAELHETIIHKNGLDSRQTELRLARKWCPGKGGVEIGILSLRHRGLKSDAAMCNGTVLDGAQMSVRLGSH